MIGDHPWFGCGPGNFQSYYTRYKVPEASETIADPHNFLLEIAATAGLPSLVLFLLAGVALAVALWRRRDACASAEQCATMPSEVASISPGSVYAGVVVGFLLAFPAGWAGGIAPDFGPALGPRCRPPESPCGGCTLGCCGRLPAWPLVVAGVACW